MGENEIVLFSDDIFNEFCYGDPLEQRRLEIKLPSGKSKIINEWALHARAKINLCIPKENGVYVYWISPEVDNKTFGGGDQPKLIAKDVNSKLNQILKDDIGWLNIR